MSDNTQDKEVQSGFDNPEALENTTPKVKETTKSKSQQKREAEMQESQAAKELNQESQKIEQIKRNEKSSVIDARTYQQERERVQNAPARAIAGNDFAFKAGKDPVTGKRQFNVKGMADVNHVYRGSRMIKGKKVYYFFGEDHDSLFRSSDKDKVAVNAWTQEKGQYVETTVGRNEIAGPVRLNWKEARDIIEDIRAQGDSPRL